MTANDILFERDYLTIFLKPEKSQIKLKWKKFATSEQFRDGLNTALEAVREHGIKNWLANLKNMEVILPADEEWATNEWFPKIATAGLEKMAIVTSLDYFNNVSVKRIVASRVNSHCSKPDCGAPTSGPQVDPSKALNIGVAAHIAAASPGGARYDASMTPSERKSTKNAIWLCQTHAKLIDNESKGFMT